jgi:hypothetical protein
MLSLVKLVQVEVQGLDFFGLEPVAIG